MKILGIGGSDCDFGVCLLKDGVIVAAIEEERLSRQKHSIGKRSLVGQGIAYCLDGIDDEIMSKVDHITGNDILHPVFIRKYADKMIFYNHHLTHAASSYYLSGFEEAAVLVADGAGSKIEENHVETISYGLAKNGKIDLFKKIVGSYGHREKCLDKVLIERCPDNEYIQNSLGNLYRWFTSYVGFDAFCEGKTMGLAAYGSPKHCDKIWSVVDLGKGGDIKIDMADYTVDEYYSSLIKNKTGDALFKIQADIAASVQYVLEECTYFLLQYLYDQTQCKNLCLAGGIFLNSVMNGKILERTSFENLFIQPAAGDSGTALGAALLKHYEDNTYIPQKMVHAFLGNQYDNHAIENAITSCNDISYTHLYSEQLYDDAAKELSAGKILGWFQGGCEFGPRALGHRSILANPTIANMKDELNARVKFRESFRPFAPVVLEENTHEYFNLPVIPSPYMLIVADVKKDKQSVIPAVTHIDGTARVQTANQNDNPQLYRLIKQFNKYTNVPVILNTSFNVKGEPIVETPQDAINCYLKTNMDILYLGNYKVQKTGCTKRDSERLICK